MKIPGPGRMVDIGGRALHVQVSGDGSPAVVLEAGLAATSVSWPLVTERIAAFTTVLAYDRAGLGWSESRGQGRATARDAAIDLAALLAHSGFAGPFILVGHSFGGLIVRLLQQDFPRMVAGLVLVDPVVRDEWREMSEPKRRMLARGVTLSRRGALLARLGIVRLAIRMLTSGSRTAPKLVARLSGGGSAGVASRLVGEVNKIPKEFWPAIAQHWSEARSFETMAENLEQLPVSVAQLDERRALGDLPLIVLSAGRPIREHVADVRLSSRGESVVVEDSGHWLQLDAPDAVVNAIRRVIDEVRSQ